MTTVYDRTQLTRTVDAIGGLVATGSDHTTCGAVSTDDEYPTACTRRPGHQPPHEDDNGRRWFPPLTDDERRTLVAISRWNRTDPNTGQTLPSWRRRWEPSFWSGWWHTQDRLVEVCWAEDREPSNTISVTWRERRYDTGRVARFEVTSVREAVDVLAALGVLPARFSSAFVAGYRAGVADVPTGGPHVEPAPIQDPALAACCWLNVAPFSGGQYHASDCRGRSA